MRVFFLFLSIVTVFSTISGCAKFNEKFGRLSEKTTKVTISSPKKNYSSLVAVELGGMMVYAVRTSDQFSMSQYLADEFASVSMTLPNGNYTFYAVGWTAGGITGTIRCGKGYVGGGAPGSSVALNGAPTTVSITVNAAGCDNYFSAVPYQSGSIPSAPDFVFCGSTVDISGKIITDACTGNTLSQESSNFMQGLGTVETKNEDLTSTHFLFMANPQVAGNYNLYSIKYDGTGFRRINSSPAYAGLSTVTNYVLVPGTNNVIYISNHDTSTYDELYIGTIGAQGGTKLSGASPPGPCGAMWKVQDLKLAPDKSRVAFVAKCSSGTEYALYSVKLDGTDLVEHFRPSSGPGIFSYTVNSQTKYAFGISADSNYLVFTAKDTGASLYYRVHSVAWNPTSNSAPVVLSHVFTANAGAKEFLLTSDSAHVVYKAEDSTTASLMQLWSTPIGSSTPIQLNNSATSIVPGVNYFVLTSTNKVVYLDTIASNNTITWVDKYSVGNRTQIHSVASASNSYEEITPTSDSTKAIFVVRNTAGTLRDLYSGTLVVSPVVVQLNVASTNLIDYTVADSSRARPELIPPDNSNYQSKVFFVAQPTASTKYNLYSSLLDGSANNEVIVNGAFSFINAKVHSFAVRADGFVAFTADANTSTVNEAYTVAVGAYGTSVAIFAAPPAASVDSVHMDNKFSGKIFISGKIIGATGDDMYFKEIAQTTPGAGLTNFLSLFNSPSWGRYQVSLLQYTSDPAGNIISSSNAISSACLTTGADGGIATPGTALKIPYGESSGTNPFAVAIDVYPMASTCTGTPTRYIFNKGLAGYASSANVSPYVKVLGNASANARIFIKDK